MTEASEVNNCHKSNNNFMFACPGGVVVDNRSKRSLLIAKRELVSSKRPSAQVAKLVDARDLKI